MKIKRYLLEVIVFICGAVVMAFEIVGARMLGPYVGTSAFVWSAIIGVILISLAAGYYSGGRLADLMPRYSLLAVIIFLSAIFMVFSAFLKDFLLDFLLKGIESIKLISILASLLLFSPPAILLGMVSPFAVRLKIRSLKTSGATAGFLYALSTLGSILGTFLAGFYLIPTFPVTGIIYLLAIMLGISSTGLFLAFFRKKSNSTITAI